MGAAFTYPQVLAIIQVSFAGTELAVCGVVAGVVFLGWNWLDSQVSRSSGTLAMPTCPR